MHRRRKTALIALCLTANCFAGFPSAFALPPVADEQAALQTQTTAAVAANNTQSLGDVQRVAPNFYRGDFPDAQKLKAVKAAGVTTIVSLCNEKRLIAREQKDTAELGLKLVSIPLSALRRPADDDVKRFLEIAKQKDREPIYLHCLHGRDRTGAMVGVYRVVEDGWSGDAAYREMLIRGFRPFFVKLASPVFAYSQALGNPARSRTADLFGGMLDRYIRRGRSRT